MKAEKDGLDAGTPERVTAKSDRQIMEAIRRITDSGGSAEVKRRKDGGLTVYKVRKEIAI